MQWTGRELGRFGSVLLPTVRLRLLLALPGRVLHALGCWRGTIGAAQHSRADGVMPGYVLKGLRGGPWWADP